MAPNVVKKKVDRLSRPDNSPEPRGLIEEYPIARLIESGDRVKHKVIR